MPRLEKLSREKLIKAVQDAAERASERLHHEAAAVVDNIEQIFRAREELRGPIESLIQGAAGVWIKELNPRMGGGYRPSETEIEFIPAFRLNGAHYELHDEPYSSRRTFKAQDYRVVVLLLPRESK